MVLGWGQYDNVGIRREQFGHRHTRRRQKHRRKMIMWRQRQRLKSPYKPRNTWGHQKPEKARRDPPLEAAEGAGPCQHLDGGYLASRTVRQYIPVVLSLSVCDDSPRKLTCWQITRLIPNILEKPCKISGCFILVLISIVVIRQFQLHCYKQAAKEQGIK